VRISEALKTDLGGMFLAEKKDLVDDMEKNEDGETPGPSMAFSGQKSAGGQSLITIGLLGLFVAGCSLGLIQAAKRMRSLSKQTKEKYLQFQDSETLQGQVVCEDKWGEDKWDDDNRQESLRRQLRRQQKNRMSIVTSAETSSVGSSTNDGEPAAEPASTDKPEPVPGKEVGNGDRNSESSQKLGGEVGDEMLKKLERL